jgi:photosystem II stability/assembly factor-like uncharacterized protein
MKRTLLLAVALAFVLPAHAAPRRRAVTPSPFPPCSIITGTPAVTFTRDHGETLTPTAERLQGVAYTYGLIVLDSGTLLAWHKDDLILSTDAGCNWRTVATFVNPEFPPTLTAAPGERAYAWSDHRQFLVRYDSRGAQSLKAPGSIAGLGVDRSDGDRLRAGTEDGVVWESTDAGQTWDPVGRLETGQAAIYYRFAFDPANLDHIVAGTTTAGAFVTFDGGRSWTRAEAFGSKGGNAFELVISPADPNVVWMAGLDNAELDDNAASHGRHIYRSTDGGRTFAAVVGASATVTIVNGPVMAAHPRDANIVYFVFGTHFQAYGTDLFRYDASRRSLTVTHNDYDEIGAITFSPAEPSLMYLGLSSEQR